MRVNRRTVDLSAYPDLVVIYLGMRVNALRGIKTLFGFGSKLRSAIEEEPDGLLHHEDFLFSLRHIGIRQYWRDFDSLEAWARSAPHAEWWRDFLSDSGGTGFWHEAYLMRGGMEAMYDDVEKPLGFMRFAPVRPARGPLFGARTRLRLESESRVAAPLSEEDVYGRGVSENAAR